MKGFYEWLRENRVRSGCVGALGAVVGSLAAQLTDGFLATLAILVVLLSGVFAALYALCLRDQRRQH